MPWPVLGHVPGGGRLLVQAGDSAWVVASDGSKRRLGAYAGTSWSPHGLFVVGWRGSELTALDPGGNVRWSSARRRVASARWGPVDGYRIAYVAGRELRIVNGDGSNDHRYGAARPAVAPAWRPDDRHVLAYVDGSGRVSVVAVDSRARLWRSGQFPGVRALAWSPGGRRLLVVTGRRLAVVDRDGKLLGVARDPVALRRHGRGVVSARGRDRDRPLLGARGSRRARARQRGAAPVGAHGLHRARALRCAGVVARGRTAAAALARRRPVAVPAPARRRSADGGGEHRGAVRARPAAAGVPARRAVVLLSAARDGARAEASGRGSSCGPYLGPRRGAAADHRRDLWRPRTRMSCMRWTLLLIGAVLVGCGAEARPSTAPAAAATARPAAAPAAATGADVRPSTAPAVAVPRARPAAAPAVATGADVRPSTAPAVAATARPAAASAAAAEGRVAPVRATAVVGCAAGGATARPLPEGSVVRGPLALERVADNAGQPARAFATTREWLRRIAASPRSTARERRLARLERSFAPTPTATRSPRASCAWRPAARSRWRSRPSSARA